MIEIPIAEIQGDDLWSPLADATVRTSGIVTGHVRRGYFIQTDQAKISADVSNGLFIFSRKNIPAIGDRVAISGKVIDFIKSENEKPVTQLLPDSIDILESHCKLPNAFQLHPNNLPNDPTSIAKFLNGLEGMLIEIAAGATFISPSNSFGDYVLLLKDDDRFIRSKEGGVLLDPDNPHMWYPNFRIVNYQNAPRVNLGSTLNTTISGPLNYRASSYQIAVNHKIQVEHHDVGKVTTSIRSSQGSISILTLNAFNLDAFIERPDKVQNPKFDIDDDVGDGKFDRLANDIVRLAGSPDIIALQEIQDNDGAEQTQVTDASLTYQVLIAAILRAGGPEYNWVDIAPDLAADGGQPGGNIRNGFLYKPEKVHLVAEKTHRIGEADNNFENSRKPLVAYFENVQGRRQLAVINVHLVSKRQQNSIFSPENPGKDMRESLRINQALAIKRYIENIDESQCDFYVTGDFNDFETSDTLKTLVGENAINLVDCLPVADRYDYNHRGKLHALMHGIVDKSLYLKGKVEYEILHGNELIGVKPGEQSTKASDHAYVIACIHQA